jgi:uncharacterized glyoxalase superfamily protein PhnB
VPLNEYYVEIQAGLSRHRLPSGASPSTARTTLRSRTARGTLVLDFEVGDVDAEYHRVAALGVAWVMPPTTQPGGAVR